MEIYINPLTPEKLAALVDQVGGGSRLNAAKIQETLHFAQRNLIWASNADGIADLIETYPRVDLDRTYGKGSLLCYAASAPLLARGGDALAPLEALLRLGADPLQKHDYRLCLTEPLAYRGDFDAYLNHMVAALGDMKPSSALAVSVGGKTQKALESITSIKSRLSVLFPQHAFPKSLPLPAARPHNVPAPVPALEHATGLLCEALRPQDGLARENRPILIGPAPFPY